MLFAGAEESRVRYDYESGVSGYPTIDLLVLTALKDERDGVLSVSDRSPEGSWTETRDQSGFRFDYRAFFAEDGSVFQIAVARAQGMGQASAATAATRLVQELEPRFLAMCGVCAGRRDKVFLGDLVVADRLYQADSGKIVASPGNSPSFLHEVTTYNLDPRWKEYIEDRSSDWTKSISLARPPSLGQQGDALLLVLANDSHTGSMLNWPPECPDRQPTLDHLRRAGLVAMDSLALTSEGRLRADRLANLSDTPSRDPPLTVHIGPLATVTVVTQDPAAFLGLAVQQRNVLALDLEGSAIGLVGELMRTPVLVAKAVQDWADNEKDDRYREFASRISARFVVDFFRWLVCRDLPGSVAQRRVGRASDDKLRAIAKQLLDSATPPSLVPLFAETTPRIRSAINEFGTRPRRVRLDQETSFTVPEIAERQRARQLMIAPRGSGKTFALWHMAEAMLTGAHVPLFLPMGRFATWAAVLAYIRGFGGDPIELLSDSRVVLFLDGWSEFAGARGADSSEHRKALATAGINRIIASARFGSEHDARFEITVLEPLPGDVVRRTYRVAFPNAQVPNGAVLELLRLPLALVLHMLLGGPVSSRGELLAAFHRHVSHGMPTAFTTALTRAAARTALTSATRRRSIFEAELHRAGVELGIAEAVDGVRQLGTLDINGADVRPVHDLYWSWLVGAGLLETQSVAEGARELALRESIELAIESGLSPQATVVDELCVRDAVLATRLARATRPESVGRTTLQVQAMLTEQRLAVNRRGALAGLQSADPEAFRRSLEAIASLHNAGLYILNGDDDINVELAWEHRSELANWIGANGTSTILETIADRGDSRWVDWLETLVSTGRLTGDVAGPIAISCSNAIPTWTRAFLPAIAAKAYRLRPAANRGANIDLAKWIASDYEDLLPTNSSTWIDLNRVLVQCGDDSIFESLLERFEAMPAKAQEVLGYGIVERGEPWIARFQERAFANGYSRQHHKLGEQVSALINDETARRWVQQEPTVLGWRVLIKRHGSAMIPELLARLPQSFSDLHLIPELRALASIHDAPEVVVDEIWKRVRGTMQPMAMEDVLKALSRCRVKGIPSIVGQLHRTPFFLPTYHFNRFLGLLTRWETETGLTMQVSQNGKQRPFSEWIRLARWSSDRDDELVKHGLLGVNLPVSDDVLDAWVRGDTSLERFVQIAGPLNRYHAGVVSALLAQSAGFEKVLSLFKGVLGKFPEGTLLLLLQKAVSDDDYYRLLGAVETSNEPSHRRFHKALIDRFLQSSSIKTHHARTLANVLRIHPPSVIRELLNDAIKSDSGLWLARDVELATGTILLDERGEWS